MSFSRWYPVSSFYYDPSIQPTKPIANLQQKDESQFRKVPKGRYDTTYRREYLNFANVAQSMQAPQNQTSGTLNNNNQQQSNVQNMNSPHTSFDWYYDRKDFTASELQQQQLLQQQQNLSRYQILPPITPQGNSSNPNSNPNSNQQQQYSNSGYGSQSIDHIIGHEPPSLQANLANQVDPEYLRAPHQPVGKLDSKDIDYLPIEPIYLSPDEESALMQHVNRDLGDYRSDDLKRFYTELTSYDPNLTGFTHHAYISMVAMRNNLPVSEPLLRFVMSRFVSSSQERGFVNYEELVKFLARCLGGAPQQHSYGSYTSFQSQQPPVGQSTYQMGYQPQPYVNSPRGGLNQGETYDPDEQAILIQMHENMRDWDQVNLVNCDQLRKKFYEVDPYNRYILTQREIEDVVYKNRIPIQRSLIFQILEKYCKVATGQYRWPAFVDFLEKTYNLRLPNKKKTHYVIRDDEREQYSSEYAYRTTQLDALRSKANEEERLEEINKQIYNLQHLKEETKMRIDSRLGDVAQGESWFTRFMRLANAMYSHRVNAGIEFALPKDEARRLITAYNTVYELNIPEQIIEDGLNRCMLKGNVKIDDLLKVLSKVQ